MSGDRFSTTWISRVLELFAIVVREDRRQQGGELLQPRSDRRFEELPEAQGGDLEGVARRGHLIGLEFRVGLALGPMSILEFTEDVAQPLWGETPTESNAQEHRHSDHLVGWSCLKPRGKRRLPRRREGEFPTGSRTDGSGPDETESFESLQLSIHLTAGEGPEIADEDIGMIRQPIAIDRSNLREQAEHGRRRGVHWFLTIHNGQCTFDPMNVGESPMAISVKGLKKNYGKNAALRGVNLEIRQGEIFALLGPNGAGKTTFVEILEGFRHRDEGEVQVLGMDPDHQPMALKTRVGIVLQSSGVDRYLNVAETVAMYSSYYPHPRPVDEILVLVGLEDKRNERVLRLSGGQQRRLDVAIALAGNPDLLFLDEPTTGFDPSARREVWEVIKNLRGLGKTVVLTTHFMDEAQYLADRLAVIANGQIVAEGNPETLAGRDRMLVTVHFSLPPGVAPPPQLDATSTTKNVFEVRSNQVTQDIYDLTSWALGTGVDLEDLRVERPTLEDVYLELTAKCAALNSNEVK